MGLGSLAEGQHPLPHPRRFSEDGRSTASLPRVKIQNAVRHAITKPPKAGKRAPFPRPCCRKDTKPDQDHRRHLPLVKKSLTKKALRGLAAVSAARRFRRRRPRMEHQKRQIRGPFARHSRPGNGQRAFRSPPRRPAIGRRDPRQRARFSPDLRIARDCRRSGVRDGRLRPYIKRQ